MIKAVLLDCGGVMVAPSTGDWMLGPGYEAVLGDDFAQRHLAEFRTARRAFLQLLPDANIVEDDRTECVMFSAYYAAVFGAMGLEIAKEGLERLADMQVNHDDRYIVFEDVLPYLEQWKAQYRLGIISDAPPSTRRIMDRVGVTERIHGATYSCEIGILKPNPGIYASTLKKLGVTPEEAVFVDDLPHNLFGAQALGIRGIQMRRPMPQGFAAASAWDGPIVHDFSELDGLLRQL